jgi:hypothetical protein
MAPHLSVFLLPQNSSRTLDAAEIGDSGGSAIVEGRRDADPFTDHLTPLLAPLLALVRGLDRIL